MMERKKISEEAQTEVLIKSRRRCCLCLGLQRDAEMKRGQIAHLDQNRDNNNPANLAFLCLEHHDIYDSRASQSKGFRISEVKVYREELYSLMQKLALKDVVAAADTRFSEEEEEEALIFLTGSHRSRSLVHLVASGPKTVKEITELIPPFDWEWTESIIQGAVESGWVRRLPGGFPVIELSHKGRKMLDVLDRLPDELKEKAWKAVWLEEYPQII